MNKQFARVWVGFTLIFIVLELTYVNSKSLNFLSGGSSVIDGVFAIVGSIAFSMVTVLIMMLSKRKFLKIVFPIFDAALLFSGFNIHHADNLLYNPVMFYASIFFSVFTGVITYSLGQINAEQYSNDESRLNQIESKRIIEDLAAKQVELNRIIEDLTAKQVESNRIIEDLMTKQNESKKTVNETKRLANEFLQNHILHLNWNNSKKKEANRNGHEAKINMLAQRIKSGESITIDDYLKSA